MLKIHMNNPFTDLIKKTKNEINKLNANLLEILETATIDAINEAVDRTPPTEDDNERGTGMITGTLKSAWANDSITKAKKQNNKYITVLANSMEYASFVNDGHRMDKHFVPGLIINPYSGLLEKAPAGMEGGITVGTKTKYVVGKYMKENALIKYYQSLDKQAKQLMENIDL